MSKSIETLNADIRKLLLGIQKGEGHLATQESLSAFGVASALSVHRQLNKEPRVRPPKVIYASEIGTKCPRKIWYKYHGAGTHTSTYPPNVITKFMVGDLVEQLTMVLIEASGHTVSNKQEPVSIKMDGWEVRGKIDCIVDGTTLVDIKSTTSFGMRDFKEGAGGSKFGYSEQLLTYSVGLGINGVPLQERGFVAVDKTLGHIHYVRDSATTPGDAVALRYFVSRFDECVNATLDTLSRYKAVPTSPEGCGKLCPECSYCDFKHECWKDANSGVGIRSFLYAGGKVVDLVKIGKKEPKVPEITNAVGLEELE